MAICGWYSVKDRKPTSDYDVLVQVAGGQYDVCWYDERKDEFRSTVNDLVLPITHWMRIPSILQKACEAAP